MTKQQLRTKLESLPDSTYIDILDTLLGFEFGLTSIEWIEYQYSKRSHGVLELLDNLE